VAARFQNRHRMLEEVAGLVVDRPFEQLSLNGIADACGISLWALRYNFDNVDRLYRAVAHHLIEKVVDQASCAAAVSPVVVDTIADYARFVADLVRRPDYRDLLYLVVRNGRHHEWLRSAYEQRIVGRICADLEQRIRQSGERHGLNIVLRDHAAQRFHRRIETELVLSSLLPSPVDREPVDLDKLLKEIVRETFEATYVFEWGAATAA
jgi:AcrR family transcriptional regulator